MLPVRFQSIRCDPAVLNAAAETNQNVMPVVVDNRINVIITQGLEIRGLKANIAPRRQGAQNPLLESYERIPYFESLNSVDITDINAYLEVVTTLAKRVAKNSANKLPPCNVKDANDKQIAAYENSAPQDFALYHLLKEQLETGAPLESLVSKYKKDLPRDPLNSAFQRERLLRPLLDVICENSPKKLSVAEVTTSNNVLAPAVKAYIANNNSNVNYVLSTPHQEQLDNEVSLDAELTVNNWRLNSGGSIPAPNKNLDLIVVREDLNVIKSSLDVIAATLKPNGFALVLLRDHLTPAETLVGEKSPALPDKWQTELVSLARKSNLVLVAGKFDGISSHALLFRSRILSDLKAKEQRVIYATENDYKWVNQLKTELENADNKLVENVNIWVVANDTPNNGIVGLTTCLKLEQNGHHIRSIFTSNLPQLANQKVDFSKSPFKELLEGDLVSNVLTESSANSSYRHLTLPSVDSEITKQTKHAFLNVLTRGDLSSLRWFESENKNFNEKAAKNDYLAHVYYAPLNFRDVMLASGKLPPDALPGDLALEECILGLEFAGRDASGKRIMGMVPAKGLATDVVLNNETDFIYPVPDNWTLEQAATVPVAYSTAYYALIVRGGLQPGESVLIHSGSGGVGQAAISICLSLGCQVFTTVGSYQKREFLKSVFPQLADRNFANSRDTTFEQHVLRVTKGRGVDIVLNSLSEEKLQASIRCLAQHGRFCKCKLPSFKLILKLTKN